MKNKLFIIGFLLVLVAELVALGLFAAQTPNVSQNAVEVNEIVQSVTRDFDSLKTHENSTAHDYVVIDNDGNLLFATRSGLSETINAAITHRDTILDITTDGATRGKVIIYNDGALSIKAQRRTAVTVLSVTIAISFAVCVLFFVYLHLSVVKPFRKLNKFAERVAGGNLDIPLEMDRQNVFGAFTESFDIMRSELKKARIAEAQANLSKKELVAKLSHDIKTPVASIKAVSEVGLAVTKNTKDKENYTQIIAKTDQINSLVNNLFTATLEEMEQLVVSPVDVDCSRVNTLLENADYLHRATIPVLPDCTVYADSLRLQQVFDNIFANSYKYAKTDISVTAKVDDRYMLISIEDFGGGVPQEELPVLKEKFKRGTNAANVDGAGLGLYISDYFMKEMGGELNIENGEHGLKATVALLVTRG